MINNHTKEIIISAFCDSEKIKQALKIAIFVGTVLNLINQGDYIFNMMLDKINYFKLVLTYFVPFFVSTYTAVSISLRLKIGDKAVASTNLRCKKCKSALHVEENDIIPNCPNCGDSGIWKTTN